MRTPDEIQAGARPGSPFSNGTEGVAWSAQWCGRPCAHDAAFQRDEPGADGCPLLLVALTGSTPAEWLEQPFDEHGPYAANRYHCVEFQSEGDGPGPEPVAVPDPPGQGELWPRGPFEATRMLTRAQVEEPAR
jgi:hypothetical protein